MNWLDLLSQDWLLGIIVGALLGEGINWLRELRATKRKKKAIRDELHANKYQIAQKRDIVQKMIRSLEDKKLLPGLSVPISMSIFINQYPSVVESFNLLERDNLHVIYCNLSHADAFLDSFEQKFKDDSKNDIIQDPWTANISWLKNIDKTYEVTAALIDEFLRGKPRDVFYRHSGAELWPLAV